MVKSILDTDLYKFSTSYAYMKLYPEAEVLLLSVTGIILFLMKIF